MVDLLKEERLQLILSALRENGRVTVAELSRRFQVSEITIRRDLRELADQGLLRRAHGGAILPDSVSPEPPVIQRMAYNDAHKKRIGRAAAALIQEGESVFIGSGSTNAYVVPHLTKYSDLTVVTNALNIATELATAPHITVVVLGGMMRASELSLIGHIAELSIREVTIDKAVLGIPAISSETGLTNDYLPEVMTDRAIIEMASELIIVADHSKFGKSASAYLAPIDQVHTLVTDAETNPDILDQIRARGVCVLIAD